eukprot:g2228.t1
MSVDKTFTWEQVRLKDGKNGNELYVVIDNLVYDVTEWQEDHPGGSSILQQYGGKDATNMFKSLAHSHDALEIREEYLIGKIKERSSKL